jgi:hypothetical protein
MTGFYSSLTTIRPSLLSIGDDSYHALCFTCRQCGRRIEELVFAKTSQGIYCMECHNERAARSRRHHEKKKRAKAKLEEEQKRDASGAVCSPFYLGYTPIVLIFPLASDQINN